MAKIILSKGETVLREVVLVKERVTIGRRPDNDIVIDDLAISGEHAVIVTLDDDSFLEDLNSTNGTQVNGQPVRKHFLQNEDVVQLAQFRIRYIFGDNGSLADDSDEGAAGSTRPGLARVVASLQVLNGPNVGKEIGLAKVLTSLGRPGVQVAVVTRCGNGYFLARIEGEAPILNNRQIGAGAHLVADGDVIEMSGTRLQVNLG